nr:MULTISPECIES: class I SAM-dependent methyltransferase [unclassified Actinomyces]
MLTPEGWALLGSLPPYEESEALRLGESLRAAGHDGALVAAALTQQRLRSRAAAKFGDFAQRMLFTPDGLEQATRLAVSAHHAARYARAGVSRVADLGCGIGGDALALAGLGLDVLAVERDEPTAALATVNLMPFERARVRCADALTVDLEAEDVDAVFADPARRANGRRLSDPEQWSPRLSQVLALRERVGAVGVKVAPGTDHAVMPPDCHAQWVSVAGDVVEAALWCGPLAPEGPGRSALVLSPGPDAQLRTHLLVDPVATDPSSEPEQLDPVRGTEELGEYLMEPDGAVIRAGLVAEVARRTLSRPVGTRIAYLTGDTLPEPALAPFVTCWRLREVLPLHLRSLKARVRERGIGRLEIHKRGVDVSPDALRASLRLRGPAGETWVLTRVGQRAGSRGAGAARAAGGAGSKGAVLVVEPV